MWALFLAILSATLVTGSMLEVFATPHSHLDVGWLETFNSYYNLNVSKIIPGAIQNLVADPAKRFSWAEISYFQLWWEEDATPQQKNQLRQLLASGQWEFVDGGYVQHDQGCPTAEQIINQMTVGHTWLRETFGMLAPKVGWSIDPFGSSTANALLYSMMGMETLVINRIPDDEMDAMKATAGLEFQWSPSLSLPNRSIFTHVFDSYFCMPGGFRWGMNGNTDPFITPENVAARAQLLVDNLKPRQIWFRTPNLLLPWGCDFMFQNASLVFDNTDKLFAYINANSEQFQLSIRYATVSEYFAAVRATNITWPERANEDFFPLVYNEDNGAVQSWAGYFTSRPVLKQLSRTATGLLRAVEQLFVLHQVLAPTTAAGASYNTTLSNLRAANAIVLHHDSITGTMCQGLEGCTGSDQEGGDHNVLSDYEAMLLNGMHDASDFAAQILTQLSQTNQGPSPVSLTAWCNAYTCPATTSSAAARFIMQTLERGQSVAVVLYNSLGSAGPVTVHLELPVSGLVVVDTTGTPLPRQQLTIKENWAPQGILTSTGDGSGYNQQISFEVPSIPPVGFTTVFIQPAAKNDLRASQRARALAAADTFSLGNSFFTLYGNTATGPVAWYDVATKTNHSFTAFLAQYFSAGDDAYSLAVKPGRALLNVTACKIQTDGPIFVEATFQFGQQHSLTFRVYQSLDAVIGGNLEIILSLGLVDLNTELVAVVASDVASGNILVTDDNGFEGLSRVVNRSRPMETTAYPGVASVFLRDAVSQLSVVGAVTHTVQSLAEGELQVFVHRRLLGQEISDAVILDDQAHLRQSLLVSFGAATTANRARRGALARMAAPVVVTAAPAASPQAWASTHRPTFSALQTALPANLALLSLQANDANATQVFLRLQHTFEVGEDAQLSQPVTLDLATLFADAALQKIAQNATEMTLTFLTPLAHTTNPVVVQPLDIRSFSLS